MSSSSPEEIRAERERAGWDKETAAAAVCVALRSWQAYETGFRQMPAATWMLFTLLTGRRTLAYETGAGRAVLRLAIEAPKRPATT
jgi:hypothetical protein